DTTNLGGTNTFTAPLDFTAATSSVGINVVNPNGTANNVLTLNGTVNLGTAGLTYTGFGLLNVNGVVSGSGGIVANSSSTLTFGVAPVNTDTGGTTINSGIVATGNTNSLGTGTVTVNNGGTLFLLFGTVFANPLNLNGFGFGGNGALTVNGAPIY